MTPAEARLQTKKGIKFATAGAVIGLLFSSEGTYLILLCGYGFWALYHGVQIARPIVGFFYSFGPVHLETQSIFSLFYNAFILNVLRIMLLLCFGFMLGAIGGAILRQFYLSTR